MGWLTGAAGFLLILMMVLTCANILLRRFGLPLRGTFEIMGFLGAVIFAFSLAYSHEKKEHLYVSIIFDALPKGYRVWAGRVSGVVCLIFFSLLSFQLAGNALNLKEVGEVSETLHLAYYPVLFLLSLGILVLVIFMALELFSNKGDKS